MELEGMQKQWAGPRKKVAITAVDCTVNPISPRDEMKTAGADEKGSLWLWA
jgi:hypothetical protein